MIKELYLKLSVIRPVEPFYSVHDCDEIRNRNFPVTVMSRTLKRLNVNWASRRNVSSSAHKQISKIDFSLVDRETSDHH